MLGRPEVKRALLNPHSTPEQLAALDNPDPIEIFPDEYQAVRVFARSQTQWRRASSGVPTGLDYPGAFAVAAALGIEVTDSVLGDLQTLEIAYVNEASRQYAEDQRGG